jgi:RNA-directed DNA polymerase
LVRLVFFEAGAWESMINGRGPWWNSGTARMKQALAKKLWGDLRLASILDTINRLNRIA